MRRAEKGIRSGIAVAGALALFVAVGCESYNEPQPEQAATTTAMSTIPAVAGSWDLTLVSTTGGAQTLVQPGSTMTLSQSGTSVSGDGTFGTINGSVNEDRGVKLNIDVPNDPNNLTLSGTVNSDNDRMSGTWTYQGGLSGTWDADKN